MYIPGMLSTRTYVTSCELSWTDNCIETDAQMQRLWLPWGLYTIVEACNSR